MDGMDLKKGIPFVPDAFSSSVEKAGDDGLSLPGACNGEELRPCFLEPCAMSRAFPLLN